MAILTAQQLRLVPSSMSNKTTTGRAMVYRKYSDPPFSDKYGHVDFG